MDFDPTSGQDKVVTPSLPPAGSGKVQASQWQESLRVTVAELGKQAELTEQNFLRMGERLLEVSLRVDEITERSAAAASMLGGERVLTVIQSLGQIVDRMEEHAQGADRRAEKALSTLRHIEKALGNMRRLMLNLKEQVNALRMLKMLTNIQSASLGRGAAGFTQVAEDIQTLSLKIQQKSVEIIGQTQVLQGHLDKALSRSLSLAKRQKDLAGVVVSDIRNGVASLAGMQGKCSSAALNLSGRSGDISVQIGSVVMSMQAHDITRQQMQHVVEALTELDKIFESEEGDFTGGMGVDHAAHVADVCELQKVQLENSAKELSKAIATIIGNLNAIAGSAVAASERAHEMVTIADAIGHASLAEIEDGLNSVMAAFEENIAANGELGEIMRTVTETMGQINRFLEDIEDIGLEIKLIALNAIIKAAQAGKDGAALSVIAGTVKHQSEEICTRSAAVTDSIGHIVASVSEVRDEVEAGEAASASEALVAGMVAGMDDSLGALKEITTAVFAMLTQSDRTAASLAGEIGAALGGMKADDMTLPLHRVIIPALSDVASAAREVQFNRNACTSPSGLGSMARRYTMQSERSIHRRFAGSDDQPDGSVGEVFGKVPDGSLGENVELF